LNTTWVMTIRTSLIMIYLAFLSSIALSNGHKKLVEVYLSAFATMKEDQLLKKIKLGNDEEKLVAYYYYGKILFKSCKYRLAYEHFLLALSYKNLVLPNELEYKLNMNAGLALRESYEFAKSLPYFYHAKKILPYLTSKSEEAYWAQDVAGVFYKWGKYDSASVYLYKAIFLFKKHNIEHELASLYNQVGAVAHFFQLTEEAIKMYEKAKHYSERFNLKIELIHALANLGIENIGKNNFELAAVFLDSAMLMAESEDYTIGKIQVMQAIANLFALKNDTKLALEFLIKSDELAQKTQNLYLKSAILFNIGTIYKLNREYDDGEKYYTSALQIQLSSGLPFLQTELALAEVEALKKNYQFALIRLARLKKDLNGNENRLILLQANLQYARIYLNINNLTQAEKILLELWSEISNEKVITQSDLAMSISQSLSEIYIQQNNIQKAFAFREEAEKIRLESFEKRYAFNLAKIQSENQLHKLEQELKLAAAENKIKTTEITIEKRKSIFLLFGLLLISFFLSYIYVMYLAKKKLNIELVKRNLELAKQIPFQEIKIVISQITDEELSKSKEIIEHLIHLFENKHIYLQNDISLLGVANMLDTNRTYLSKAIKDILGTNFNAFINKYRIDQARKMLSDPQQKLSIEGIAEKVGFNSKSTFNSAFKAFTGLTPSLFREEVLQSKGEDQ